MVSLGVAQSKEAHGNDWVDTRAFGPFVCRADFPLQQLDAVFHELAEIQHDLVRRLQIPPARERIEIYLFKSRTRYDYFLKTWFPTIPYRRALYAKNNGPGMVLAYYSDELATDIRHECTHALLHAALPMVPLWLDEGLAEYYEVSPAERIYSNPHRKGLTWSLRFGQVSSIEELEAKRQLREMGRGEYRSAWVWVHFLLHGPPQSRMELIRYLSDIRAGTPPGQFSQRLSRQLPDANRHLIKHFKMLRN